MSSAFDVVDHQILFDRLEHAFGLNGRVLDWIRSYLSSRSMYVCFNGNVSSVTSVVCGIPQGCSSFCTQHHSCQSSKNTVSTCMHTRTIYRYMHMSARRGHPILLLGFPIASRRSRVGWLRIAWNSTLRKQRSSGWDLLDSFIVAQWLLCSSPEHGLRHHRESATWALSSTGL